MFELHVREFACHLLNAVHVAEGGREDELVALIAKVAQNAFGVGRVGNVVDRGDGNLVAEMLFERAAGEVVLRGPTFFAHGTDIDKGHLEGAVRLGGSRSGSGSGGGGSRGFGFFLAAGREHQGSGARERELEHGTFLHDYVSK